MKTVQDFIKETEGSAELQTALKEIKDKDALAEFLKKNDVDGTVEDFGKAIKAKTEAEGALSDDEAENAAGGRSTDRCFKIFIEGDLNAWFKKIIGKSSATSHKPVTTDPVPLVKSIISVYYCDNPDCSQYNINCGYVTGTAPGCPVCSGRLSMR